MADKVDKKLPATTMLPVTVETKTRRSTMAPDPFPAAQLVSLWALINVSIDVVSGAPARPLYHYITNAPSWLVPHDGSGGAAAASLGPIVRGLERCVVVQAAAAALALLLPGRHRQIRRALACVALVATVTYHFMFARALVLMFLAAKPGAIFFWTMIPFVLLVFAAIDVVCFLLLGEHGSTVYILRLFVDDVFRR